MSKYVKKTNNPNMGRPKKNIDQHQFESLCNLQCTLVEIAGFFDCCEDTIESWCKDTYNFTFSEIYKIKSAKGKVSLRRFQFKQAETNPSMAIWLGKQYLGQTEKVEQVGEDKSFKALEQVCKAIQGVKDEREEDRD